MKKLTLLFICLVSVLNINAEIYSGSCGTNAKYSLDTETGILSITGTGPMTGFYYGGDAPWYSNRSYINTVNIADGVTSIGEGAFSECSLTTITIPSSVTSIGDYAFGACSSLTSVTIPNSVTSIGEGAFGACSSLTSIEIPNSVTSIGSSAFRDCSGLTYVTIGNSVKSIGDNAFACCEGMKNVGCYAETVPSTGSSVFTSSYIANATLYVPSASVDAYKKSNSWSSFGTIKAINNYDGIYYEFNKTTKQATVIQGKEKYKDSVTIPETVVTYNGETYDVTSIGNYAFRGCSSLTSIEIPNSVTSIGERAFYYCSGLTSVSIPNSVTSIGIEAFSGCSGLTAVNITDLESWCKIKFGSFSFGPAHRLYLNGSEVTDLVIPNGVTSIGNFAFESCSGLTSIIIPNSVTSIGDCAFRGCSSLTSIEIPNSVTSIGHTAFYKCTKLTFITIPNSVTSIGDCTFEYCSGLKSVTIPNSVTSIGSSAFRNCSGLTSVTCEATSVPSIEYDVFSNVPQSRATLYVPASALKAYKTSPYWNEFGTIVALPEILRGDVNGDGEVDMDDSIFVTNIILDTEAETEAADVNNDGKINIQDVMFIVNYIKNGKFPDE